MRGMSGPIYAEQHGKNMSHVGSALFEQSVLFFSSFVFRRSLAALQSSTSQAAKIWPAGGAEAKVAQGT